MLEVQYLIVENKTLKVEGTYFTEEEALIRCLALSERENKRYSVARIIAETECYNFTDWKLFKWAGSEISIKQIFEKSEFVPREKGDIKG